MKNNELYKLKIELELQASQSWGISVEARIETDKDCQVFIFTLGVYTIIYSIKDNLCDIVYTASFLVVDVDLSSVNFNLALASCLGLEQSRLNQLKNQACVKKVLSNKEWNRKLYIQDLTLDRKESFEPEFIAQICISRPLDNAQDISTSLAYPLTKDDSKAIIDFLEYILKKWVN